MCVCVFVWAVWISATVAVTVISLVGLVAVVLIPVMSRRTFYNHLLHFLVAVAIATLTGDALLHLLPHVSPTVIVRHRIITRVLCGASELVDTGRLADIAIYFLSVSNFASYHAAYYV